MQGKSNPMKPSHNVRVAGLENARHTSTIGQDSSVRPDLQSNPFALPPSKKRRALNDGPQHSGPPVHADAEEPQPALKAEASRAAPTKAMKPTVRFSDMVQGQGTVAGSAPSTTLRPRPPVPAMTPTYRNYIKRPRPDEEDPISDIEEELQVMDTPTSSQQDLIQDHEMEDDIEYVHPPLPRKAFPPSNPPAREMSPDIPIDRLSVAATHHSAQANTPSHVFGGTTDSSSRQYPLPTQTAPLMYTDDLDTRYRPGSPSDIRNQINSKRRDIHAEIQQLITETETTQREVIKEDSTWRIAQDSAAAYHLGTATNNMRREIHSNSVMLQELLELDRLLEHASDHAFSVLRRIKGQKGNLVPRDESMDK